MTDPEDSILARWEARLERDKPRPPIIIDDRTFDQIVFGEHE